MTFTELIAEIKWESKLENDSTWDAHLLLLIWDEMVQIASLQIDPSLYVPITILAAANQGGAPQLLVEIPTMIKLDRIQYHEFATNQTWYLPDKDSIVPPVPVAGKPRCYEMCQGTPPKLKILLIPQIALGTDTLYVSYWAYPAVPAGGDTINPVAWIQSLKTNCIRRAQIFNSSSSDIRAQLFDQILQKAEAVSGKSNSNLQDNPSDTVTNKR